MQLMMFSREDCGDYATALPSGINGHTQQLKLDEDRVFCVRGRLMKMKIWFQIKNSGYDGSVYING